MLSLDCSDPVIARMQDSIQGWEATQDHRAIFLTCYAMMTQNMLTALAAGEFENSEWVDRLLRRFAAYYFNALEAYETGAAHVPEVWRAVFDAAKRFDLHVMQHLFLGVNAHINYDLVLVIHELLRDVWSGLGADAVRSYYQDHCHVNAVIKRTINAVQDQVVERYSPAMDLVDQAMGRLDEVALGQLISHWREEVWVSAVELLNGAADTHESILSTVIARGCRRGEAICLGHGILGLRHLL